MHYLAVNFSRKPRNQQHFVPTEQRSLTEEVLGVGQHKPTDRAALVGCVGEPLLEDSQDSALEDGDTGDECFT